MAEKTVGMPIAGANMKMYRAPIAETEAWVLVGGIQGVTLDGIEREMVDVDFRAVEWKASIPGKMNKITASFKLLHNVAPAMEKLLRDDLLNGTPAKYAFVNGDITQAGTEGWVIPGYVSAMPRSEEMSDLVSSDMKIDLGYVLNASQTDVILPEWLTVA